MQKFLERISHRGSVEEIAKTVCKDYNFGNFESAEVIQVGYEDFNFSVIADKKKYFVKVFANFRSLEDCKRYVDVMLAVIGAGVRTPKLLKSVQGWLHIIKIENNTLRLCVMDYIEGKTYFDLGQLPTKSEIKFLASQASIINLVNIKPSFIYDSWAISNFPREFSEKAKYLEKEDEKLIRPLLEEYKKLKIDSLSHCFVHGDMIATNVMKDSKDKIWIIDFSVSNYYPRIQELAVLACNLFFNEDNKGKSEENLKLALSEYEKKIQLTEQEVNSLPTYIRLAHAMHVLGATYSKASQNNISKENEYWLNQGRKGLEQTLL